MSEFRITVERSPDLSDGDVAARLWKIYQLALRRAEQVEAGQIQQEASVGESLAATPAEATEKPAGDADLSPK